MKKVLVKRLSPSRSKGNQVNIPEPVIVDRDDHFDILFDQLTLKKSISLMKYFKRPFQKSGNASELWDFCRDSGKRSLFLLISFCSMGYK